MPDKLYFYVDESGQDTKGLFFVVSVILRDGDQDTWNQTCESIEKQSGKGRSKWTKSAYEKRMIYSCLALETPLFSGKIAYAIYNAGQNYDLLIARTIVKAFTWAGGESNKAVIIDGLHRRQFKDWGKMIRSQGAKLWKVSGATDDNDPIIRLADSICGLVRDACYDKKQEALTLVNRAQANKVIINLGG